METKIITLRSSKSLKVQPLWNNHWKHAKDELGWLSNSLPSITVSKLYVSDKVVAECQEGIKCLIKSKGDKTKQYSPYTIVANVNSKDAIIEGVKEGSIGLTWMAYDSNVEANELPNEKAHDLVMASMEGAWNMREESQAGDLVTPGFRAPQIGAIYSILANSIISDQAITVVLPTGTGKSETILATIIAKKIQRSLILVPSDGLRNQFFRNCQTWGILRKISVLKQDALNPVVMKLASSKFGMAEFTELVTRSNIIIATASILNTLSQEQLSLLADKCSTVFVDEAHHSAAPTWESLKIIFSKNKIIQFTATPFREDRKPVRGKIVFDYPLEAAQRNGYFTKIDFIPVVNYDSDTWDQTIAEKAIEVLEKDLAAGHNHFLMARVDSIDKARLIYEKYYKRYKHYRPLLITSKSPGVKDLIDELRQGKSRVVVCVNMLGEGIDIPELKIAALHDIRKSLTITIQFVGRFTRSNKSAVSAKIIANIADVKIEKQLKQLYKENADWGKLIAFASAKEIQKKIAFQKLLADFKDSKLPLFNIKPKLSATVYHTIDDQWRPERLDAFLAEQDLLFLSDRNQTDNVLIGIFQNEENIDWLDSNDFIESTWELLLFYFDKDRKLFFANSSLKTVDDELVNRLVKVDYRFQREAPFKCYHGLGHVVLFTLGIDKNTDSPIKYAMYAGEDVYLGISDMEKNKSSKSNTYGYGFANGEEITLGASKKGKIWSRLVGNIQEWIEWCDGIGDKLLNETIDVNTIFSGFLKPERFVKKDLEAMERPISVDWPTTFYADKESNQAIIVDDILAIDLSEIDLSVRKTADGFDVILTFDGGTIYLRSLFDDSNFRWQVVSPVQSISYKKKKKVVDLLSFLKDDDTFKIRLIDGTFIENNYHFKPFNGKLLFPLQQKLIRSLDWAGTNLNEESMGLSDPPLITSIQHRIFKEKAPDPNIQVIVNDDERGEAADLICFGLKDDQLLIEVIHCKYKLAQDRVGSRLSDFYELCGQAQKNIKNFSDLIRLFDHIRVREMKISKKKLTRFIKGDLRTLELLIKSNSYRRPKIKVTLVQPALSKSAATPEVLELIGSTYTLLQETLNCEFEIICSA